jgi:phosphoribosylanthranilate isomerase
MKSKICGISDSKTLKFLINHSNPPHYIGFIVNYLKSKRFVGHNKLKALLKINKKNSKFVAVLVKPDENILEEIKDLPFDYYQIYDCSLNEKSMSFDHQLIKNLKINKELMLAGNIQIEDNLINYKEIADIVDISGGLETSGLKDISKINIFLNKVKQINDEA